MNRFFFLSLICCAVIPACSGVGGKKEKEEQPFGPTGIPPQLRGTGPAGTAVKPGGNVTPNLAPAILSDEDLVFTDPDNPDAELPELGTLLSAKKKGPWESSPSVARRLSSREGKPLLIWFTDSKTSPMCKAISQELFSRQDFGEWADEKLIRLRIDQSPTVEMESLDRQVQARYRMEEASAELKKRYKVMGHPTLLLLSPGGEVIGRYRGYKRGEADFKWGLIKHGEAVAAENYKGWRANLEKKGYREWKDTKDRKVFARLVNYNKGELVLIEPDGMRSKTREDRLSSEDREWIKQQKMLRGIQ